MAQVHFENVTCTLGDGESVLDGLLRSGAQIPHSCKSGVCGSCLLRAVEGEVPPRAQAGLKDSWRVQGYFLACVCHPSSDLRTASGAGARVPASIAGLRLLSQDVMEVRLKPSEPFEFRAGQYVTLFREDGVARSYSVASLPEESEIALHVRHIPNGKMSTWLHSSASTGDPVGLAGPSGECFYVPGREDQPLLLAGAGTGLAPLYGIVQDALAKSHRGPIHLFHGAVRAAGLYLVEELKRLAHSHPQFTYTPTVLETEGSENAEVGSLDQVVVRHYPKLGGFRSFLCGDPGLVQKLKKTVFLNGAASRDIFVDAFLPSA